MNTTKNIVSQNNILLRFILDFLIWVASSVISYFIRFGTVSLPPKYIIATLLVIFSYYIFALSFHLYEPLRGPSRARQLGHVFICWIFSSMAYFVAVVLLRSSEEFSRIWLSLWLLFSMFGLLTVQILLPLMNRFTFFGGGLTKNILVAYRNQPISNKLIDRAEMRRLGYKIEELLNFSSLDRRSQILDLGLDKIIRSKNINEIWICLPLKDGDLIELILKELNESTIDIRFFPSFDDLSLLNYKLTNIAGFFAFDLNFSPITGTNKVLKRIEDILVSFVALVALSPVLIVIASLVKLTSTGPVLFSQKRYGLGGKEFKVLKFRTMIVHSESEGKLTQAIPDDPRATNIGKFLRKTSLDELPQLINVLAGTMSIVGPRPHAIEHNELYKPLIDKYMWRHKIKPGITGWAQVLGLRGKTDHIEKMEARIKADLWYIDNWSIYLDTKIIFWTLAKGMTHKNAV